MTKLSTIRGFAWQLPGSLASKPVRAVLKWQLVVTIAMAVAAAFWLGIEGAISALLGGLVMMIAGGVYAAMTGGNKVRSAGDTLRALVRDEASKIGLIVLQLWVVLTAYAAVVPTVFIGTFVVAVLIYPIALLIRD